MRFSSVRIAWIKKHSEMSAICESKSLLWQSSRPMLFAFFEHDFYVSSYLIYFQAFDEAHAGVRCHQDIPIVTIAEPHKEQQDNLVAQHGFLLNIHRVH